MIPVTPAMITGVLSIVELINDARKVMLERGEWTEEHEAAYRAKSNATFQKPYWQPETKSE